MPSQEVILSIQVDCDDVQFAESTKESFKLTCSFRWAIKKRFKYDFIFIEGVKSSEL